ncbi:hypothetical protein Tco_0546757 [Tanacetum coccineum]
MKFTRFPQKFDEKANVFMAWERFNDLLRGCPHHGFSELHQLDTFYNALNSNDQDSLNSAAGAKTASTIRAGTLPVTLIKYLPTLRKILKEQSHSIFEPIVSYLLSKSSHLSGLRFSLMEKQNSFLALEDDPTSSEVDPTYQDPEGDILLLEAILNSEPPPPHPNHEQYMPEVRKEHKLCEAKAVESSVNEPPEF